MFKWYLVHTKPSGETLAEANLLRQGYQVYLPLVTQPVRRRYRWCDKVSPLFPRYLFVQLEIGRQSAAPIKSTLGVANVVMSGAELAVVPDAVIAGLRAREDSESGLHHLGQVAIFEPGRPIKIAAGPFSGLEGVFQSRCGDDRIIVLLNVLGESTRVRVSQGFVTPTVAAA